MKKFILLLLLFLCLCQLCVSKTFKPVILAGLGKSWICGGASWMDPLGAQIGIESKIVEMNENLSFNAGLGFSLQGAAYEESEFSGTVRLSYLNVPLLFNYESNCGFYGEIGLQPGLLIGAKDKVEGGESYDYKDFVKNIELGVPIGLGYQVNEQLGIGVRATIGITNLDDSGSDVSDHNYLVVGIIRYLIDFPFVK